MERPKIIVEGKTYEMPKPKGRTWRKILAFDKNHNEIFAEDFIEKRCEILAEIYGGGLTTEMLLDKLYLEEILPAYREVVNYVIGSISAKIAAAEKNVGKGEERGK